MTPHEPKCPRCQINEDRIYLLFDLRKRYLGVLLDIRRHFGRDKFHAMLPPDLKRRVIEEMGDGVQ